MAKKLYAAYGSNINLEQMAYRCPHSTVAGTAMLKGYELQFRHHATIEPNEESEVPVLLWELDSQDEKFLDRYEGEPKYYRKENISLELNGETVEAMVYIMNGDTPLEAPTEQYYGIIKQGYKENGLDTRYLETAFEEAVLAEIWSLNLNSEWRYFDAVSWILCKNYALEKYSEGEKRREYQ